MANQGHHHLVGPFTCCAGSEDFGGQRPARLSGRRQCPVGSAKFLDAAL